MIAGALFLLGSLQSSGIFYSKYGIRGGYDDPHFSMPNPNYGREALARLRTARAEAAEFEPFVPGYQAIVTNICDQIDKDEKGLLEFIAEHPARDFTKPQMGGQSRMGYQPWRYNGPDSTNGKEGLHGMALALASIDFTYRDQVSEPVWHYMYWQSTPLTDLMRRARLLHLIRNKDKSLNYLRTYPNYIRDHCPSSFVWQYAYRSEVPGKKDYSLRNAERFVSDLELAEAYARTVTLPLRTKKTTLTIIEYAKPDAQMTRYPADATEFLKEIYANANPERKRLMRMYFHELRLDSSK